MAHAPHLTHLGLRHPVLALGARQGVQIAHTLKHRLFFGQVVGELGQGFGRPYAHAHRQAGPLANALAHLPPQGHAAAVQRQHLLDTQKAFVNAVDLEVGRVVAQDVHHALAHVGVQRVVGGQGLYAVQQCQVFEGEPRRTHLHAQRLHLVGASHGAAIVVGQHHHGHVLQTWLKHTLATDIKIVDIHQGKLRCCSHG